jgi:hypothetical protein
MADSDILAHYGIKGMKWGVRRTRAQIDSDSPDVVAVKATTDKIRRNRGSTDPLSNKELEAFNRRLQLERTYNELVGRAADRSASRGSRFKKEGQKFVREITLDSGKQILKGVVTAQGTKALNAQVEAALQKKKG